MVNSNEEIAIVGWAQTPAYETYLDSEPTLIMDVVNSIIGDAGIDRNDIESIDINPVLIADGNAIAVDALVALV